MVLKCSIIPQNYLCSWMCIRYGQLSGMVEPVAGLLGAFAVVLAEPLLPYALAFAAGAMVYVVVDDIIPEAQVRWATEDFKDWQRNWRHVCDWFVTNCSHKTSECLWIIFYIVLSFHQWQWKAGILDFHPGLHSDDVTGCGPGLTTSQKIFSALLLKQRDQMNCFNSTKNSLSV